MTEGVDSLVSTANGNRTDFLVFFQFDRWHPGLSPLPSLTACGAQHKLILLTGAHIEHNTGSDDGYFMFFLHGHLRSGRG